MLQVPAIPSWDALHPLIIHSPVEKKHGFDPNIFLATIGEGRKSVLFPKKQTIFEQGDRSDAVFYIQNGKVKLTVVSKIGREATIGILGDGEFLGEGEDFASPGGDPCGRLKAKSRPASRAIF